MMNKKITIFTPTYNRSYTLTKLYESLKRQTSKNFVWSIVDDGSTDDTKNLIESFQKENCIEIHYLFQQNRGKHVAVNLGLRNAETDFFCVIDSDDYLSENAVSEMEELSSRIWANDEIAAFTFIHFQSDYKFDKNKYGSYEKVVFGGVKYEWEFPGEMVFCFKTKVHQQFYFPEFENEKFCPESLVFRRIERQYKILVTDKVLAFGDYLEDGLSKSFYKLLLKNPQSALLNIKERLQDKLTGVQKIELAKTYWDIASKTKRPFKEKFFGINPLLILQVLIQNQIKRNK